MTFTTFVVRSILPAILGLVGFAFVSGGDAFFGAPLLLASGLWIALNLARLLDAKATGGDK